MAFEYKVLVIEEFADDAATKALLDAEGANNWELVQASFQPDEETGKSNALCIFKK
jgi:hypothetical protein